MSYIPRLDFSGMHGNAYWYASNPFYQSGYGLPNCTCYAWGRTYEITGSRPKLSLGNANEWWSFHDGYARGQTPKLGAVMVFGTRIGESPGHVAVVEQIDGSNNVIASQSNYGGKYFETIRYIASDGYNNYDRRLYFKGFIYTRDDSEVTISYGIKVEILHGIIVAAEEVKL